MRCEHCGREPYVSAEQKIFHDAKVAFWVFFAVCFFAWICR